MIELSEMGRKDVLYTFVVPEGSYHFSITHLQRWVDAHAAELDRRRVAVTSDDVAHLIKMSGIEPHRVRRMTDEQRDTPVLIADFETGHQTICDGNHRVVRRWLDGYEHYEAFWLRRSQWEPFLVNVPPEMRRYVPEKSGM